MKKLAIIGCGEIAWMMHIPAAIDLLQSDAIFLVEKDEFQFKLTQEKFSNVTICKAVDELPLDITHVVIASPPHTHFELLCLFKESKPFILCEKPIVANKKDLENVQNFHDSFKEKIHFCHLYRFFPNRIKLKSLLRNGFFGDQPQMKIEEGDKSSWNPRSGYNFRSELVAGGVVLDAGIHSIDLLIDLYGYPSNFHYFDDALGGIESNARFEFQFSNGSEVTYELSRTFDFKNELEVNGNGHHFSCSLFEMNTYMLDGKICQVESTNLNWETIGKIQLENFLNGSKSPYSASFKEAYQVADLIFKAYEFKKRKEIPTQTRIPGELY